MVVQHIPQITSVPAPAAATSTSSSSGGSRSTVIQALPSVSPVFDPYRPGSVAPPLGGRYQPPPPSVPANPMIPVPGPNYPFGSGGVGGVGGVGSGDLNPTFGGVPPSYQPPGSGSGSGSLVGPSHPFFTDGPSGGGFGPGGLGPPGGLGSLPGLPQPRFDPYGPVTGPYGPNVGDVGVGPAGGPLLPGDPRGPWPGRVGGRGDGGRGRGLGLGRGRRAPGEPNPDHLPPPGDDDSDMYT